MFLGLEEESMRQRDNRGSGLVETLVGCLIIVPIVLFLIDCSSVIIAQTANDALAKQCARAAAECPDVGTGTTAANLIITQYTSANPGLITAPTCVITDTSPTAGAWSDVQAQTTYTVNMPVPIPFSSVNHLTFQARSVEPVVSNLGGPGT